MEIGQDLAVESVEFALSLQCFSTPENHRAKAVVAPLFVFFPRIEESFLLWRLILHRYLHSILYLFDIVQRQQLRAKRQQLRG